MFEKLNHLSVNEKNTFLKSIVYWNIVKKTMLILSKLFIMKNGLKDTTKELNLCKTYKRKWAPKYSVIEEIQYPGNW